MQLCHALPRCQMVWLSLQVKDSMCWLKSVSASRDCRGWSPLPLENLAEVLQGGAGGQGAGPKALPAAPSSLPQPEPLLSPCPCYFHRSS